jgi:hypothetical protein
MFHGFVRLEFYGDGPRFSSLSAIQGVPLIYFLEVKWTRIV